MLKQLFKYKWYLVAILILIIAEPSLNSMMNFMLQHLFNLARPEADRIDLLRALTSIFLLWMLKRVLSYSNGIIKARFICNAKRDVKKSLFQKMMKLDTSNITEIASSGEYISIFTNDITILETRFYNQVIGLISGLFSVAILGTSFVALNAKLAFPIIAFGVASLSVPVLFSHKLNEKSLAYSNAISKFTQKIKEYMVAYPTIKNYSIESEIEYKFNGENTASENAKFDADCALTLADSVGQLLAWFMQVIGVGLGLIYVVKGEILIGTVIAAQAFANDLAGPLQSIIMNVNSIRSVKQIVKKLESMTTEEMNSSGSSIPAISQRDIKDERPAGYSVTFDDISLKLGNNEIIKHFSFNFEEGKKYLVIGLNGAGKSSVFKALKKWYGICGGQILLGGEPITNISSQMLSQQVSYLNENVALFSGSVRENIALFRSYNEDAFQAAITGAQVNLDLNRQINEDGVNVSSGEQRRIEIARSLMSSVKVFIFDEVVSTLDIETAYEIENMALGFKDKTVIFISHNFSGKLIKQYDEILIMQNGELIDHGTYEDLISRSAYFKKICNIKFG